jgi:thiamine biosynthesis lipoprotein
MKRRTVLTAMLGLPVLGAAGLWLHEPQLRAYTDAGIVFGTTVSMTVLHENETTARAALSSAFIALREVDALMSVYRTDSQVGRLNQVGWLSQPDPRLVQVLEIAQYLAQQTDGAFDVTVQPLWQAANTRQPQPINQTLSRVGWQKLDISARELRFREGGMAMTLNGIAQGYGADQALAALKRHGIRHALLDAGELASIGANEAGDPWSLAVSDPRSENRFAQVLAADGRCLASSGDYATHFTDDFSQHHIVDPHTGTSPTELAAVSVLAPSGLLADGLSTACMVLGTKKSLALAASLQNVDVLCITKSGVMHRSPGFPQAASGT